MIPAARRASVVVRTLSRPPTRGDASTGHARPKSTRGRLRGLCQVSSFLQRRGSLRRRSVEAESTLQKAETRIDGPHCKAEAYNGSHTLCAQQCQGLFTLFSKYFSSFVHTTCSLSVLVKYLAFAGVHLRIWTALSNCPTLGRRGM